MPDGSTSGVFSNRSQYRLKLDVAVVFSAATSVVRSPQGHNVAFSSAFRELFVGSVCMEVWPNEGGGDDDGLPFWTRATAIVVGVCYKRRWGRVVSTKQGNSVQGRCRRIARTISPPAVPVQANRSLVGMFVRQNQWGTQSGEHFCSDSSARGGPTEEYDCLKRLLYDD